MTTTFFRSGRRGVRLQAVSCQKSMNVSEGDAPERALELKKKKEKEGNQSTSVKVDFGRPGRKGV